MEISQLTYFNAVVQYRTVTNAAKQLNVTQSAVSKSIAALEQELGTPLFIRSNRTLRLTQSGERFLEHVRIVLNELEYAKKELSLQESTQRELRLRVETPEHLLGILESYLRENPDTRIIQSYESPDLETAMLSGEIDFCITGQPSSHRELEWQPLLTEPIYLMVRQDHPLAQRKQVALAELAGQNFISFSANPELDRATREFCRLAGFTPHVVCEAGETPDLQKLVEMGLGIAFCSSCIRLRRYQDEADFQESDLPFRYVEIITPRCERTIGISRVRGRHLTGEDQRFLEFIRQYFNRLDHQIRTLLPR